MGNLNYKTVMGQTFDKFFFVLDFISCCQIYICPVYFYYRGLCLIKFMPKKVNANDGQRYFPVIYNLNISLTYILLSKIFPEPHYIRGKFCLLYLNNNLPSVSFFRFNLC